MITETATIQAPRGPMNAYIARPDAGEKPAVIVLEGIYGFDDELKRITDLTAAAGFVGIAIDYLRAQSVDQGGWNTQSVCDDVAAARDWLNERPYVQHGRIATWGFGIGGSAAFMASTLAGLSASIAFYGQSIAKTLPDGADAPIKDAEKIKAPLLLVFGGADEQVAADDITRIQNRLTAAGKTAEIEIYPNVGHSFFRQDMDTVATREIADAWDRVQSFLSRHFYK